MILEKLKLFSVFVSILFLIGCAAEENLVKTVLTGDSHSLSWQKELIQMRKKYEVFIGKTTNDLVTEMGEPSSVEYDVLRSGHTYDEVWNYTFSKGIPLLTESQNAVWFFIEDGRVVKVDVF